MSPEEIFKCLHLFISLSLSSPLLLSHLLLLFSKVASDSNVTLADRKDGKIRKSGQ